MKYLYIIFFIYVATLIAWKNTTHERVKWSPESLKSLSIESDGRVSRAH